MTYKESHLDRSLKNWFVNDNEHQLLRSIRLTTGSMRGLSSFNLLINYPITAIAGKNGSGKSTILAIACCAFHNDSAGFKLPNRKQTYYTFADFFVQHAEDVPSGGINISYLIAHNGWRVSDRMPNGVGVGWQKRFKKKGGKWNDYAGRVERDVVFLGIERIVPHSEKSQSKSYSRSFSYVGEKGWEVDVMHAVGKILGKKYEEFKYVSYSKYRLPLVVSNGRKYSGFHMGAGENALFEMLSVMHSVSEGALVVIDEIELGLHSEAQKKFVLYLKELCKKRKLQILCTTHSRDIFGQLPNEARIFVESVNGKSIIFDSISPEYAFSKLSAENLNEIYLLVEDNVAKALLSAVLPASIRSRVSIEVIGSASALVRQLSSNYIRKNKQNLVVIFDGDQRVKESANLKHGYAMTEVNTESDEIKAWMKERIEYLPGDTWPESWIVQKCSECIETLSSVLSVEEDRLVDVVERGLESDKHCEFTTIGGAIGLDENDTLNRFCMVISQCHLESFTPIIQSIQRRLNS